MKVLKHIRVAVSVVMLFECAVWVLMGISAPRHSAVAAHVQLVPSALGTTLGAGIFWLVVTLLLGRVYCAGICPAGTLQDIVGRLRWKRRYRYRRGGGLPQWVFAAYAGAIVAGIGAVPLLLEPWPWFAQALGSVAGDVPQWLAYLGVGAASGAVCALASGVVMGVCALLWGRAWCTDVCPLGTAMGHLSRVAVMHIELIPDRCTSCLKCEDVCKGGCISIKTRSVDNDRCVRCFNCVAVCPDDAIRYTVNRRGIVSALMQRRSALE